MNVKWTVLHFWTIKDPIEVPCCSFWKILYGIALSIQILPQKFKSVVFEKDDLVHLGNTKRRELSPPLINQNSNFDVQNIDHDVWKRIVRLNWKGLNWQLDKTTKQVELKNNEFENFGMSILIAFSGICGPSAFHFMEKTNDFQRKFPTTIENFRWRLWRRNSSKLVLRKRVKKINLAQLTNKSDISGPSKIHCRNGNNNFSTQYHSKTYTNSTASFSEKIKSVAVENKSLIFDTYQLYWHFGILRLSRFRRKKLNEIFECLILHEKQKKPRNTPRG